MEPAMADLPEIIPIFPLPNFVLFPGVKVPLHIFEPRYREMVAEVAMDHGIIGMMMLKGNWERDYYDYPDVYEVGCAGKISALVQLPDGKYNLMLDGMSQFRVLRENRDRPFRQAQVQWCPPATKKLELDVLEMEHLHERLVSFLGNAAQEVWSSLVEQRGLRGAELINFICFHLDVSPIEKQTLLEAGENRAECLLDVMTFRLEERKLGPGGNEGGDSGPVQ
jgi:Lon protease-like protein